MRKKLNSNSILRVLGINFAILVLFLLSPAILYRLYSNVKSRSPYLQSLTTDPRAYYPTYADKKFSIELFNEEVLNSSSPVELIDNSEELSS